MRWCPQCQDGRSFLSHTWEELSKDGRKVHNSELRCSVCGLVLEREVGGLRMKVTKTTREAL